MERALGSKSAGQLYTPSHDWTRRVTCEVKVRLLIVKPYRTSTATDFSLCCHRSHDSLVPITIYLRPVIHALNTPFV